MGKIKTMTKHFKTICKECDSVISQCRCQSPDKEAKYDMCSICEKCKKKEKENNEKT